MSVPNLIINLVALQSSGVFGLRSASVRADHAPPAHSTPRGSRQMSGNLDNAVANRSSSTITSFPNTKNTVGLSCFSK